MTNGEGEQWERHGERQRDRNVRNCLSLICMSICTQDDDEWAAAFNGDDDEEEAKPAPPPPPKDPNEWTADQQVTTCGEQTRHKKRGGWVGGRLILPFLVVTEERACTRAYIHTRQT